MARAYNITKPCSVCGLPRMREGRYCLICAAAYMREWRKTHPLTPEQRLKMNCRSYANVYKRRGRLIPGNCADCNSPDVEMHHPDYSKPLFIIWLCRPCHLFRHRFCYNGRQLSLWAA